MGHVMLMGLGSMGDVNPLLRIGVALGDRRHRVTLISASQFESAASSIGTDFTSVGTAEAYDAVYADADPWHPRRGLGVFFHTLPDSLIRLPRSSRSSIRPAKSFWWAPSSASGLE